MNLFKILILCCLIFSSAFAQNPTLDFEKEFKRGEEIFSSVYEGDKAELLSESKGAYTAALPIFLNLYTQDTTNMNLAFKIGVCYLSSKKNRAQSIPFFEKAARHISNTYDGSSYKERNAPPITNKYLGDAYHLNYQFDLAIAVYLKQIAFLSTDKNEYQELILDINRKIEMCKTGKILVKNPVNVKIQNLGSAVNSTFPDYSPVLSADQKTLFFTSRRPGTTGDVKDEDGNYFEDVYMSNKTDKGWTTAFNIGVPVNTNEHEATVGISPDGQNILIYKDDKGEGNLYTTSLNGDVWSVPEKLNDNINTKHWEPSAFISADGNTLYFTSDKPGGYGGRDLYISKRTHGGDWGKAVNMGPSVNTPYEEDAPFIHPDGVTLFFSSNGHSTMGGFDVFMTALSEDGKWADPINVGYPINTTDDDIFYVVSPDARTAYFSSFRVGGQGEKDNYMATFLDAKPKPVTVIQGNISCLEVKPDKNVSIVVTDNATEEVVGIYHPNSKTGHFLFVLTPGKNYNITYKSEGHLFYSENMEIPKQSAYFELKKEITLCPIMVGSKITLNNIFFDFDKATLRPLSNVEIKNLVAIMKDNPGMKVEISGHTDSKGNDDYNLRLSVDRARAVVEQLILSGIDGTRMKAEGYGETKPVAKNTNADGSDNPEGRQLNRRVEFTVTEIK
jgi:outer membrane protein OmpA-like peptidoglycan-associated protein/Tol biopolymer transport system component